MRTVRTAFAFALIFLLASGVAFAGKKNKGKKAPTEPGTYTEWNEDLDRVEIVQTFAFSDYGRLVVGTFDTENTPLPEEEDNAYDPVVKGARRRRGSAGRGAAQGALREFDIATGDAGSEAGTLVLRGEVLEMNPGSRAARYWAGFGAGAAGVKLEGEVVDAASGEVLLRFTQERRSGAGVGGGKYDKLLERSLSAIGRDLGAGLQRF